ncbi:MAG: molybdopterin-guanine dinucleotide biosynthesis protein B [Methylophilus sp.]
MNRLPVLGIVAAGSNAGKTTLITQLIPALAKRNIRVSVIKHAHHKFDIDYPGKDSYKIREAGAVQTLIASNKRWALMTELAGEQDLEALIAQINPSYADLILVEGFRQANIPKIEVYRPSLGMPLLANSERNIIAVATDANLDIQQPLLPLNDIEQIIEFIVLNLRLQQH